MKEIVLISTGIGHVQRGFEVYIHTLANKLVSSFELKVYGGGGKLNGALYNYVKIWTIKRNGYLYRLLRLPNHRRLVIEQFFFFLGILIQGTNLSNKVFYLGEYHLYCYLFKLRHFLGLNYRLILYTGGQAAPGLFNASEDFVHHVTDVYLPYTRSMGIPPNREFVIPHHVNCSFEISDSKVSAIKALGKGKKIILSVGIIDQSIKRMDLIPELFEQIKQDVFVILLGSQTNQTPQVLKQFETRMPGQFIFTEVPHKEIGNYYAAADYLIQCSKRESFGFMYIEALSLNLTVITHDFEEARYVLKDNALFVDMDKPKYAADKIREFVRAKKKIKGSDFASDKYSWDALGIQYDNMFRKFVE